MAVVGENSAVNREKGQGLVEFGLVLPIALLIVIVIVELGFALFSYVTVTYAAKQGARSASVYLYQPNCDGSSPYDEVADRNNNDTNREIGAGCSSGSAYSENVRATVSSVLGSIPKNPLSFNPATVDHTCPPGSSTAYLNICYSPSPPDFNARKGDLVTVELSYRHYWLIGFIGSGFVTLKSQSSARIE